MNFNGQNFDGRVFASSPQANFTNVQVPYPIVYQNVLTVPQNPLLVPQTPQIIPQTIQPFNIYENSRSIESIKMISDEYGKADYIKERTLTSIAKSPSPFSHIDSVKQMESLPERPASYQPIFSHEIPEVYNIIKSSKNGSRAEITFKADSAVMKE
jgi:hypothetical protein